MITFQSRHASNRKVNNDEFVSFTASSRDLCIKAATATAEAIGFSGTLKEPYEKNGHFKVSIPLTPVAAAAPKAVPAADIQAMITAAVNAALANVLNAKQ